MTIFTMRILDESGAVFTEMSVRTSIGMRLTLNTKDGSLTANCGLDRVVAAEVADDGGALLITVESD